MSDETHNIRNSSRKRFSLLNFTEITKGICNLLRQNRNQLKYLKELMHKKIMEKASKALEKDAKHYKSEAKKAPTKTKKKHEMVEEHEAKSAAKDLKKRAKKAHEY